MFQVSASSISTANHKYISIRSKNLASQLVNPIMLHFEKTDELCQNKGDKNMIFQKLGARASS